ncbi:MAG: helix-turn-helix domain-containing protein [Gemmatimonadota bacterium]
MIETRKRVGELLRVWRDARGLSQMALAHRAGISPRHMSFVETGRSRPGRDVLLRLCDEMDVPFRERNRMLEAAGYARMYRDSTLEDEAVEQVADVLRFILRSHEPYSAVVVDSAWNVRMANRPHEVLMERLLAHAPAEVREEDNLLVQTFHPEGLRPAIRNFPEVADTLVSRLRRQAEENPVREDYAELLDRLEDLGPVPEPPTRPRRGPLPILIPIELEVGGLLLRLFTTLTTLGTPQDALLQELRVETFFPANEATEKALRDLEPPSEAGS